MDLYKASPKTLAPAPTSLDELAGYLRLGSLWEGAPIVGGELDWHRLPSFGGLRPVVMRTVWSWDRDRYLAADDGEVKIFPRRDKLTPAEVMACADVARIGAASFREHLHELGADADDGAYRVIVESAIIASSGCSARVASEVVTAVLDQRTAEQWRAAERSE